jgi:glycine cleavage system regulatory protein|tara:strand:- start:5755 stop:6264 length:510 start_codon:yes stop_codon:yes gene_type:complete
METVLVLTISGKDRAGLVEQLAEVVTTHGGNWEHCRMAHLAGRFVGLLEVSVSGAAQQELEAALRTISDLDVMIAAGKREAPQSIRLFDLEVLGSDHPGIVRDVFKALAATGVNVEELSTKTSNAAESGGLLFEARARLACGPSTRRAEIQRNLEAIAHDLMVEIRLLD